MIAAKIVYILCAITSVLCAFLLLKANRQARSGLLFWSGLFFSLLGISNILLYVDLIVIDYFDFAPVRTSITAIAHFLLVIGILSKPTRL